MGLSGRDNAAGSDTLSRTANREPVMIRDELVMFCTSDFAGQVRGKGVRAVALPGRLESGIGWTPTNLMLTAFGPIADSPWGPFGDLILQPDPDTEVRVDFGDGGPLEHFFLGNLLETDGRTWECCLRGFLTRALETLDSEFGLQVLAAFEHELHYDGASASPSGAYSLDSVRRAGMFGEVYMAALQAAGVEPESFLPEYGPGQYEVTVAPTRGVSAADRAVIVRELGRATARRLGHHASFAPAVTPEVVGNGVHIHMSLSDPDGKPATYDADCEWGLSEAAGRFVAGILRHAPALCALTAPGVASYFRLMPHRWSAAWTNLGHRDREACVRICPLDERGRTDVAAQMNFEYRAADATASPYLAMAALVWAGIAGLRDELPTPVADSVDPETLSDEERDRRHIVRLPQSLPEALAALEADDIARDWFPPALLDAYLRFKRSEIQIFDGVGRDALCARYAQAF